MMPLATTPTEDAICALEDELRDEFGPTWTLTRAEAEVYTAERSGTHVMVAAAKTPVALKRAIRAQLASASASKENFDPLVPITTGIGKHSDQGGMKC
jgi:hypothetical protein